MEGMERQGRREKERTGKGEIAKTRKRSRKVKKERTLI